MKLFHIEMFQIVRIKKKLDLKLLFSGCEIKLLGLNLFSYCGLIGNTKIIIMKKMTTLKKRKKLNYVKYALKLQVS